MCSIKENLKDAALYQIYKIPDCSKDVRAKLRLNLASTDIFRGKENPV